MKTFFLNGFGSGTGRKFVETGQFFLSKGKHNTMLTFIAKTI
jgi:hypothetical protein